jgi:predicted phage-related endonuclease
MKLEQMQVHNVQQGSEEWHALRASVQFTSSDAPIIMGASPYVKRAELIAMKATGGTREVSEYTENVVFRQGHKVEELARPIIEARIGETLYPATASRVVDGVHILTSLDGTDLVYSVAWECKQWNKEKAAEVDAGIVPECDYWQCVHHLLITQAETLVYTVTDGTEEGTVSVEITLSQEHAKQLVEAYKVALEDIAAYKHKPVKVEAVGEAPESLPALRINLTGAVTASNLQDFKQQALARIEAIKTDLVTDQDFADAEQTVKFLKAGEKELEDAKAKALQDTASIDDLFRTVDDLKEQMRQKRLLLEKLVKAEKENRRVAVLNEYGNAFAEWLSSQDCPVILKIDPGIAEAMKGKKSIKGWEDAASDAVAAAKLQAKKEIERVKGNYDTLKEMASDCMFLFPDWAQLVQKDQDYMVLHVKQAIAEHQQREQAKLDAERERIRQEEAAKAKAEAAAASEPMQCFSPDKGEPGYREREPLTSSLAVSPVIQRAAAYGVDAGQGDASVTSIFIEKAEFDALKRDQALLHALLSEGVESWSKYEAAYNKAFQQKLAV